jgi:hypothetical protein
MNNSDADKVVPMPKRYSGAKTLGRIYGCFVYLILCQDADCVFIKAGRSVNPLKRLSELLTGCPLEPGIMAVCELASDRFAKTAEKALHAAFARWHHRAEWFRVPLADKQMFNACRRIALDGFATPSIPIRWTSINLKEYFEERAAISASASAAGNHRRRGRPNRLTRIPIPD